MGEKLEEIVGKLKKIGRRAVRVGATISIIAGGLSFSSRIDTYFERGLGYTSIHEILKNVDFANEFDQFSPDLQHFVKASFVGEGMELVVYDTPDLKNYKILHKNPKHSFFSSWIDNDTVECTVKDDRGTKYYNINIQTGEVSPKKVEAITIAPSFDVRPRSLLGQHRTINNILYDKKEIYRSTAEDIFSYVQDEAGELLYFIEKKGMRFTLKRLSTQGECTTLLETDHTIASLSNIEGEKNLVFIEHKSGDSLQCFNPETKIITTLYHTPHHLFILPNPKSGFTYSPQGMLIGEYSLETSTFQSSQPIDFWWINADGQKLVYHSEDEMIASHFLHPDRKNISFSTNIQVQDPYDPNNFFSMTKHMSIYTKQFGDGLETIIDTPGINILAAVDNDNVLFTSNRSCRNMPTGDLFSYDDDTHSIEQITTYKEIVGQTRLGKFIGTSLIFYGLAGLLLMERRKRRNIMDNFFEDSEIQPAEQSLTSKIINYIPDTVIKHPQLSSMFLGIGAGAWLTLTLIPKVYPMGLPMTATVVGGGIAASYVIGNATGLLLDTLNIFQKPKIQNFVSTFGCMGLYTYSLLREDYTKAAYLAKKVETKVALQTHRLPLSNAIKLLHTSQIPYEEIFDVINSHYYLLHTVRQQQSLESETFTGTIIENIPEKIYQHHMKGLFNTNPTPENRFAYALALALGLNETKAEEEFKAACVRDSPYTLEYKYLLSRYLVTIGKSKESSSTLEELCRELVQHTEPQFVFGESKNRVYVLGNTQFLSGELVFKEGNREQLQHEMDMTKSIEEVISDSHRLGVPESVGIISVSGHDYFVMKQQKGERLITCTPETYLEHLPKILEFLAVLHRDINVRAPERDYLRFVQESFQLLPTPLSETTQMSIVDGMSFVVSTLVDAPRAYYKDANPGNWIVTPEGTMISIDHEVTRVAPVQCDLVNLLELGPEFTSEQRGNLLVHYFNSYHPQSCPEGQDRFVFQYEQAILLRSMELLRYYPRFSASGLSTALIPRAQQIVSERQDITHHFHTEYLLHKELYDHLIPALKEMERVVQEF